MPLLLDRGSPELAGGAAGLQHEVASGSLMPGHSLAHRSKPEAF